MRDVNKTPSYWKDQIDELTRLIEDGEEWLTTGDIESSSALAERYSISTTQSELVSALYSGGNEMNEVNNAARQEVQHSFPKFVDQLIALPEYADEYHGGVDQHYRYLSYAVLTDLRGQGSANLVEAIKCFNRPDAGMNIYFEYLGHEPLTITGNELIWPEAYENLYLAIAPDTDDSDRAGFVETYLKNWLKGMRGTGNPIYSNLNNKNHPYTGYWCWDAAAAVVMMDIDDARLREHSNYPKDFADWGRGLK